jgi:hypothetical protein
MGGLQADLQAATYPITMLNPQDFPNRGVARLTVDGEQLEDRIIPYFDNGLHKLEGIIGKPFAGPEARAAEGVALPNI